MHSCLPIAPTSTPCPPARPPAHRHVGKFKEGLQLQGREGVVQKNEAQYNWKGQDMALSANLPWKVQFSVDGPEGKPVKVIAHLVRPGVTHIHRGFWFPW